MLTTAKIINYQIAYEKFLCKSILKLQNSYELPIKGFVSYFSVFLLYKNASVNFINVLHAYDFTVFLRFWDLRAQKSGWNVGEIEPST